MQNRTLLHEAIRNLEDERMQGWYVCITMATKGRRVEVSLTDDYRVTKSEYDSFAEALEAINRIVGETWNISSK